jgi:glycosyltransferase involved in cell wall biosynthesis
MNIQVQGLRPPTEPGGGTTYCSRVAQELTRRGHQVTLLCPRPDSKDDRLPVEPPARYCLHDPVAPLPLLWRVPSFRRVQRYLPIVRRYSQGNDLLISHSLFYAAAAKRAFPRTKLFYFAGNVESFVMDGGRDRRGIMCRLASRLNRRLLFDMERRTFQEADVVLVSSPRNVDRFNAWFGFRGRNWVVCPQGVDDVLAATRRSRDEVRRELRTPEDAVVIVTMSVLDVNKNVAVILKALSKLRAANVCLWVAGDGPERSRLEQLAAALGLEKQVRFLGFVSPPYDLLAASDVFVLASRSDTFPHVILEAMAAGLAVIGPRHDPNDGFSAVDEMVEVGTSGLLFDRRSPEQLAELIESLAGDDALRRRMGAAGRQRALSEFTWEKHVATILALAASGNLSP